ncbi:MAG: amidase family protein [Pseudomonadota bacterium]
MKIRAVLTNSCLLPLALLILAACGGDSGESAGSAADAPPPLAAAGEFQRNDDITAMTATDLRSAMVAGELSAEAVTSAFLERIQRLDRAAGGPNAVIEVNPDALAIAQGLDQALAAGGEAGDLHGVPVLVKANIDTADAMATSAGSLALAEHRAANDAHVITLLRNAGAVILGKTNLSEWANFRSTDSTSGWSSLGGLTRNPWRPTHNPCGSSSGSGAAVAMRFAPLALGTETNGSIVCPAGANGVLGLKGTMGRVSRAGVIPIATSMDMVGPMATTAADLALLMRVIVGSDPNDRSTLIRFKKYSILTPEFSGRLKDARIGVWRSYPGAGTNAEVDALFDKTVAQLKEAGAEIFDDMEIEQGELGSRAYQVMLYEFREGINSYLAGVSAPGAPRNLEELIAYNQANAERVMPHFGQEILEAAQAVTWSKVDYAKALTEVRRDANQQLEGALQRHNLTHLVSVTNGPAWTTDLENGDRFGIGSSTLPAITGHPHLTVPMGLVDGLPVGLSVMSYRSNEFRVLRVAAAVEKLAGPVSPL